MIQREDLKRTTRPYCDDDTVVEVAIPSPLPWFQWQLHGTWKEEDLAHVETALIECYDGPYNNFWQLIDRGDIFIAKRWTWEMGPFLSGHTAEELASEIKRYHEKYEAKSRRTQI